MCSSLIPFQPDSGSVQVRVSGHFHELADNWAKGVGSQ